MGRFLVQDEFIARCRVTHGDAYYYAKTRYVHSHQHVIVTCLVHGDFSVRSSHHANGQGCLQCFHDTLRLTTAMFIERASVIHHGKYAYARTMYVDAHHNVVITCPMHGDFEQLAKHHLSGHGCDKCRSSVSLQERAWLDSLGIDQQHRQKKIMTIDGQTFKVDAFVPNSNTVYEFYGDYWHGNPAVFAPSDVNPTLGMTYGQLHAKSLERETKLRQAGFDVCTIWETDWEDTQRCLVR